MDHTAPDGIHPSLSFADYLAHPAFGSSDLRAFRRGPPAMVPYRREHREEMATDATIFGTDAHCLILTPHLFDATHAIKPDGMTFQSKKNKDLRDTWIAEGRSILKEEDMHALQRVAEAFLLKGAARESLRNAIAIESTTIWTTHVGGRSLQRKGRPDWFDHDATYDLKVSIVADKEPEAIRWAALRNGWLHQLAGNRAGLNSHGYGIHYGRLVLVSPTPPHNVWLLQVSEHNLDVLELENESTCYAMAQHVASGEWLGTPDEWEDLDIPATADNYTETDLAGAVEVETQQ